MPEAEDRIYAPASVREASNDDEDRTIDVTASSEALDAHGTVLRQNWRLDRFHASGGPVLWAHDRSSIPIANATAKVTGSKQDKRLVAKLTFPPEGEFAKSDEVYKAMRAGLVRMVSVGFMPHTRKWEMENDREFLALDDLELLEISVVPVGSNPDALAKMREATRALASVQQDDAPQSRISHMSMGVARAIVAGMASNNSTEGQEPSTNQENEMRTIALALGLPEGATEAQIAQEAGTRSASHVALAGLLRAAGVESAEQLVGAIEAGRSAQTALAEANAKIATMEQERDEQERASLIAKLETEHRISPAQKAGFCATASMDALRSFAKDAPVIGVSRHQEADASSAQGSSRQYAGKPYEELSGPDRQALKRSDPETFNQLREDWVARGRPSSTAV